MTKRELMDLLKHCIETDTSSFDEMFQAVNNIQLAAIALGLPRLAKVCQAAKAKYAALPTLQIVACECQMSLRPTSKMLTLREAAEQLGYTETGLRKIVDRKGIKYFQAKKWGTIKFKPEWLDEFVEQHMPQHPMIKSKPSKSRLTWESLDS
jgi:hypothetical protein